MKRSTIHSVNEFIPVLTHHAMKCLVKWR